MNCVTKYQEYRKKKKHVLKEKKQFNSNFKAVKKSTEQKYEI